MNSNLVKTRKGPQYFFRDKEIPYR